MYEHTKSMELDMEHDHMSKLFDLNTQLDDGSRE